MQNTIIQKIINHADSSMGNFAIALLAVILEPGECAQLHWANISFDSPAGLFKTSWERKDSMLSLTFTVPPNSHAIFYFPGADRGVECRRSSVWNT
jgi:hypothetical protein